MMRKTKEKTIWVVGVDEVGRGPLAGPVLVCAVAILEKDLKKINYPVLTDSKKMTEKNRKLWFKIAQNLKSENRLQFVVTQSQASSIDKKGISFIIKTCVKRALEKLDITPDKAIVLLDGGLVAPIKYNQKTIIRGDSSQKVISLASVIAKVSRDKYMVHKSQRFSGYFWAENKGYGTKKHIRAIKKYGLTSLHRKSFVKNIIDKKQ